MSSIASLLVRKALGRSLAQGRCIFTASGIGLDQFLRVKEMTTVRLGSAQASVRKRVIDDIQRDDRQVFSEDLKNLLYIAESDEEITALVNGLKKYYKNGAGYSNFHFGAPLMRSLTYYNKTDKAIEVFSEKSTEAAFRDSASSLVLMNHLIEKRRFDDAVKIFELSMQRGFITANGKLIPSDVLMLLVEALYCLDTPEAFTKLEKVLKQAHQANCNLTLRAIGTACLFAIKQNRPDIALEISSYGRNQNSPLFRNLKAICFADLGRPEEAMQTVRLITESNINSGASLRYERHVYPLVMQHIRKAVEKVEDDNTLKEKLEDLVRIIYDGRLMTNNDLEQFLLSPINRTYTPGGQFQQQDNNRFTGGTSSRPINYRYDQFGANRTTGDQHQMYQQPPMQPGYGGVSPQFYPRGQGMTNYGNQDQHTGYTGAPTPFGRPNPNFAQRQPPFQQQQPQAMNHNTYGPSGTQSVFGQGQQHQPLNPNAFQGRPPLRSPLAGAPAPTIRKFSNPTSNRPGPDDENN
ncbi:hypothetical protein GJ496_006443 [Pomphorhynchus laevis]|nr:hypothetical protein GJ496_006443 [Pomphorhynchus laevis]